MRGGMILTFGLATASLLAGCGGGRATPMAEMGPGGIPRASYDHVFFVGIPQATQATDEERLQVIRRDIGRLATSSWESARENIFRSGRRAIVELIENLDRTEPTNVPARSLPGIGLQSATHSWPLGYVAYSVLVDFVNNYTDYSGSSLPSHDRNAWVDWWERHSRNLTVYDAARTAPEYVQRQLEAERLALTSRFDAKPRAAERGGRKKDAGDAAPTKVEKPAGETGEASETGEGDDTGETGDPEAVTDEAAIVDAPREEAPREAVEAVDKSEDEAVEPSRRSRRRR